MEKPLAERLRCCQLLQQQQGGSLSSSLQFVDRQQLQQQENSVEAPCGVQISNRNDGEEGDCMELKPVSPQVNSHPCLLCFGSGSA